MKVRRIRYYHLCGEDDRMLHLQFVEGGFVISVPKDLCAAHNRSMRAIDASHDAVARINLELERNHVD